MTTGGQTSLVGDPGGVLIYADDMRVIGAVGAVIDGHQAEVEATLRWLLDDLRFTVEIAD